MKQDSSQTLVLYKKNFNQNYSFTTAGLHKLCVIIHKTNNLQSVIYEYLRYCMVLTFNNFCGPSAAWMLYLCNNWTEN